MVVESNRLQSAPSRFVVTPSQPGLFRADGTGTNGVAALNQNGSFNGPVNPVERGEIIVMCGTGGGIKPGLVMGETDELGFNVTKDKVHVHDLHATLMHLLGFDHKKLTYRSQGRDFRLTDVHGQIVQKLLA